MESTHIVVAISPIAGLVTAAVTGRDLLTGACAGIMILALCVLVGALVMRQAIRREASQENLPWLDQAASAAWPLSVIIAPIATVLIVYCWL